MLALLNLNGNQVEALVAPSDETLSAVNSWLKEHGIKASSNSSAGDWISFSTTVGKANKLLGTDFWRFRHTPTGEIVTQALQYSIPSELKPHINVVHPTTRLVQQFNVLFSLLKC